MSLLRFSLRFCTGFPRSSRAFAEGLEPNVSRELKQRLAQFDRAHGRKDGPLGFWNGDHHAFIGGRDLVGDIIERDLLINLLLTVDTPQGRQHNAASTL